MVSHRFLGLWELSMNFSTEHGTFMVIEVTCNFLWRIWYEAIEQSWWIINIRDVYLKNNDPY